MQQWELDLAVESGVLVNIDSQFGLDTVIQASQNTEKKARAMLSINIDVDPKDMKINDYLDKIKNNSKHVELLGVHCHIGSTIKYVTTFNEAIDSMLQYVELISNDGFNFEYLKLDGAGFCIDHERQGEEDIPTLGDFVDSIRDQVKKMNLKLIFESGGSMVDNTTLKVNKVSGVTSDDEVHTLYMVEHVYK